MIYSRIRVQIVLNIFMILFCNCVNAQANLKDSLKAGDYSLTDTLRVTRLNKLAYDNFAYNVKDHLDYSQQALALAKKLNYSRGQAEAYKNLALSAMVINGDVSALRYLTTSLSIYSDLKDTVNIAGVTNYIGCYYATVKDFKKALPFLLKAVKLIGNRKTLLRLTILTNTGACYSDLKQYKQAMEYIDEVVLLAKEAKDYDWIVSSLQNSASLYFEQNDIKTALLKLDRAFSIIRSHTVSPRQQQCAYLLRGDIAYKLHQYEQSKRYYQICEQLSMQMENREYMAEIYYKFHLLDSISGNYQGALRNFKRYQVLTDSLLNKHKNEIIAWYDVKFDLKEREEENNRLLAAKKKDDEIISYQRVILLLTLLSLAAVFFAFIRLKKLNRELKDLNTRFAAQNKELEEVNGIKNKIFSVIAHDLRNPFAQFLSILDMFKTRLLEADEIITLLPFLNKSVHHTIDMMDRLLIWSKSQLNGFKVKPDFIDISALLQDTIEKLHSQITEKQLNVTIAEMPEQKAWADLEMIRIVFRNLLSNAIKFTPQQGFISIQSYFENQSIVIVFKDTGIGLTDDQLASLFSFNLKSTRGTENESGTGLGLKICFDLLVLNNGSIRVESAKGTGSSFIVTLPVLA